MNGAESLVHTLLKSGVDTCFANPGTSEMHFVAALDRIAGMRCVLGLFEGVVAGAADGYGRMLDKPAVTLLHCGPGFANAMACLHNARRAQTPIVNIVGDQATYHGPLDPPLTADAEGWARGVSGWTKTANSAAGVGQLAAQAVQAAQASPGQIATLIAPSNTCWDEGGVVAEKMPVASASRADEEAIRAVARILRSGEPAMLILGGRALRGTALEDAQAIASASGAKLTSQQFNARVERGQGRYPIPKIPYAVDQAVAFLSGMKHLILIGARVPVAFFAYPGKPSYLQPEDAEIHVLAESEQDLGDALARLRQELKVAPAAPAQSAKPALPKTGGIAPEPVAQVFAALLPEHAIVADESASFGRAFFPIMAAGAPHDWLQAPIGGAIGQGMPVATGAALACPGRRVVNLQADGSAMYTVQSLWTQAREKLDVTTVILSNRKYALLIGEYANVGANPGRTAMDMLDIGNPDLNWVSMANSMGVEAGRAETLEELADLFAQANAQKGPFLIELVI